MSAVVTAIVAVSVAAAATGYSIYAGEQGKKAQQDAMRKQEAAQAEAAKQAKAQTEANGQLVERIENIILAPTAYSAMQ